MSKVLILAEFQAFGGTRRYLQQLVSYYGERGHRVRVGMLGAIPDETMIDYLARNQSEWSVIADRGHWPIRKLWRKFPFSALADIFSTRRNIREFEPDLIVISVGTPGLFLGVLALPRPVLYVLHSYPYGRERYAFLRHLRRWFLQWRLSRHRQIVTVSNAAADELRRYWWSSGASVEIKVVPNGVPDFPVRRTQMESAEDRPLRIVTAGHVTDYKNPQGWIRVARRVTEITAERQVEFVWVGGGDLLGDCRARLRAESLDNVRFVGAVEDARGFVADCDIYFQPSLVESQGLAVLEAMCAGRPCVVTDAGGLPESVEDGSTGLVARANDIEDMVEKLGRLIESAALRDLMGRAARNRWKRLFCEEAWERRMDALHSSWLGDAAPAAVR